MNDETQKKLNGSDTMNALVGYFLPSLMLTGGIVLLMVSFYSKELWMVVCAIPISTATFAVALMNVPND